MENYKIAVVAGDGIGPEVVACGVAIMDAAAWLAGEFTLKIRRRARGRGDLPGARRSRSSTFLQSVVKGFTVRFGWEVALPFFLGEVPSDDLGCLLFEAFWAIEGDRPDGHASAREARGEEPAVGGDGEPAGTGGGEIDRLLPPASAETGKPGGPYRR